MDADAFNHYKTGIENIDLDHLQILELITKVTETSKRKDQKLGMTYLSELRILKNNHFLEEEHMMEKINFPYLEHHKTDHRKIIFELEKFIKDFGRNCIDFNSDRLVKLVLNHIDNFDRQYMPYFDSWLASQK